MILPLSHWRPAGFWIACVSLALIWLASLLGAFDSVNAWAYRQYHQLSLISRPAPAVSLIEADFVHLQPADWQQMLATLQRLQPRAIGLLQRPPGLELPAVDSPPVLMPVDPAAGSGILTLPPSQQPADLGWHRPQVVGSAGTFTSLEAALAARVLGSPPVSAPFLIDFRPGANYLPLLDARRVLAGDLTRGLIEDRVVLIGSPIDGSSPALLTPLPNGTQVSRLAQAGYSIDTLLRGQPVQPAPPWQNLLLSLLIIAGAALLYRRLGVSHALGIAAGGSLLLFLAGWLGLQLAGRVLPVAELIALHLLLWNLLARLDKQRDWETVSKLLRSQSSYLHQRLAPRDFNSSDDPWGQILMLCTQLLSLERAILLELVPGARHVREVKAWRCSIDDIGERRRDYHRTPYSTALEARAPILLEQEYLKDPQPGHRQLLAPLKFNGQLLGFLSGEVASSTLERNPLFMQLLADCAEKISELLYRRQAWLAREQRESRSWWRLLQLHPERADYQSLVQVSRLFERRLSLLENVFAHLETSTVLYNLFGQVTQVNRAMEELAHRGGLPIFNMTAADVLAALCSMPLPRAREHLQHMLLSRDSLCFSARLPDGEGSFLLYVRPLQSSAASAQEHSGTPFHIQGFLLELVDVSHLVRLGQLKDEAGNRINRELRNQLESALLACRLAARVEAPATEQQHLQQLLDRRLDRILRTLDRSQQMLLSVRDVSQLTDFPVNARTLLEETLRRWNARVQAAGLRIELSAPGIDAFVRVDVATVAPTLDALVAVLIADCRADGTLHLALQETLQDERQWACFQLHNDGYGMPDEHLQALLDGSSAAPTAEFHRLQQAVEQLRQWGGLVSAHSSLGQGIAFEILLPATHLGDDPHEY